MPTSATGNKQPQGWTLVELLVVLAILAMMTGVATLSMPPASQRYLQEESARLVAQVDAARAQSRALGVPMWLMPTPEGWAIQGGPASVAHTWPQAGTQLIIQRPLNATRVWLGPDPVMPPVELILRTPEASLRLGNQGVGSLEMLP